MTLRTRFFAATYDRQMATTEKAGLRAFREALLAGAAGEVLEVGSGTGGNLPFYGPAVTSLTMTEPQPPMLRRLQHKASEHTRDVTILRAPAEDLPFDNGSFDVAVSTLVLCGVDDQPRALRELRRVLRPGGQLLFIEHVRSGDPGRARLQDRMNWLNRLVVCCDCNRPTLDSIREAGFSVTQVEHTALPKAPKFVSPAIMGAATTPTGKPSRSSHLPPEPVPADDRGWNPDGRPAGTRPGSARARRGDLANPRPVSPRGAAYRGEQAIEVFATRSARGQVSRDTGVALRRPGIVTGQFGVHVQ
jgi:ubiquinone/menaquinone biosynthesis C-methylase UbiE